MVLGNKKEEVKVKLDEDQLKILDDLPSSAVEMQVKDKVKQWFHCVVPLISSFLVLLLSVLLGMVIF